MNINILITFTLAVCSTSLVAGPREQAKWIFEHVTGVPPSKEKLDEMSGLIESGNVRDAAILATQDENFLKVTIRNMANSWANVEKSIDFPLNDYSATVIGFVANDLDFSQILYKDSVFTGADGLANVAPWSRDNNTHYLNFETQNYSFKTQLVEKTQSTLAPSAADSPIGVGILTSRGFADAFYKAGTNRRPVDALMSTFICKKIEQLHDVARPGLYIRRDVERAPGGNPLDFGSKCAGCHAGMDALANAFSYIDFVQVGQVSRIVYTPNSVPAKVTRNESVFPAGFVPTSDHWENLWAVGQNAYIMWGTPFRGDGIKSLGEMIAHTGRFDDCMAETAFQKVCLHEPSTVAEKDALKKMVASYVSSGRKLRFLFADSAVACYNN